MAGGIERSGVIICKVRLEADRIKRSGTLRLAGNELVNCSETRMKFDFVCSFIL